MIRTFTYDIQTLLILAINGDLLFLPTTVGLDGSNEIEDSQAPQIDGSMELS